MSNPIFNLLGKGMPGMGGMPGNMMGGANPLSMFMNMRNPQQMIQQMMQANPQMRQMMTQIQNMAGDRSPKEFAMQIAKQNGIDEKQIAEFAQKMGAK